MPTVNLPELEIVDKKVRVFYQKSKNGNGTKIGISVDRGASVIELTDLFRDGEWWISVNRQPISPYTSRLYDISDLLGTYHDGLLRRSGNNYIEAVTITKPLPQAA